MDPLRLQKQLRDNNTELQDYFKDIKTWGDEMKRKESALKSKDDDAEQPNTKIPKKKKKDAALEEATKSVEEVVTKAPKDYKFWDTFDVDAECEKIDKEKGDSDSELSDEYDEGLIELANVEKEKGNKFVKAGRYEDAIKCYTNAIENYSYDPVYYANRALCHLKLNHNKSAEADCTIALQIDNNYVKALHRRATAREALQQYREAEGDLKKLLEIEPANKESKSLLDKIQKKLPAKVETNKADIPQRPASKFTLSRQKQNPNKKVETITQYQSSEPIAEKVIERKHPEFTEPAKIKSTTPNFTIKESIKWPLGDKVEVLKSIDKPLKERSRARMKRIPVHDTDIKSSNPPPKITTEPKIDNKPLEKLNEIKIENIPPKTVDNLMEKLDCNVDTIGEDFSALNLPVPITSVQFYFNWKALSETKLKFLYLRQINPPLFSSIFKDSLDTKVFSDILQILADVFVDEKVAVFEYLYGLSLVKRFSTLVMFKGAKDKQALLKLIDSMRTDSRRSKEEVDYLIKKYEM